MQIGGLVRRQESQSPVITFFLEDLWFPGKPRNKLPFLKAPQKPSVEYLLPLFVSCNGYHISLKTCNFLFLFPFHYGATIRLSSTSLWILFFMSEQNTLTLIVILPEVNIKLVLYFLSMWLLKINWQTFLPRLLVVVLSLIYCPRCAFVTSLGSILREGWRKN